MNSAWSFSLAFCSSLRRLWRAPGHERHAIVPPSGRLTRQHVPAARVRATTPAQIPARRPLRVVRIMESGQDRTQMGRLVISGRLADVCAELDRLAAIEAMSS